MGNTLEAMGRNDLLMDLIDFLGEYGQRRRGRYYPMLKDFEDFMDMKDCFGGCTSKTSKRAILRKRGINEESSSARCMDSSTGRQWLIGSLYAGMKKEEERKEKVYNMTLPTALEVLTKDKLKDLFFTSIWKRQDQTGRIACSYLN